MNTFEEIKLFKLIQNCIKYKSEILLSFGKKTTTKTKEGNKNLNHLKITGLLDSFRSYYNRGADYSCLLGKRTDDKVINLDVRNLS